MNVWNWVLTQENKYFSPCVLQHDPCNSCGALTGNLSSDKLKTRCLKRIGNIQLGVFAMFSSKEVTHFAYLHLVLTVKWMLLPEYILAHDSNLKRSYLVFWWKTFVHHFFLYLDKFKRNINNINTFLVKVPRIKFSTCLLKKNPEHIKFKGKILKCCYIWFVFI